MRTIQNLLFSQTVHALRINNQEAPLLGLAKSIYYVNKSRLRIQLNSFSILGAKLWNCLKPDLRKLRKKPFKNEIHQLLLAVLGNEDDYVDVSTLMFKVTNYV